MKSFTLLSPTTLDQALALLAEDQTKNQPGRTRVLAGGQDLLTEMKEYLATPERLVNLKSIPGLNLIDPGASELGLGALATLAAIEEHVAIRERWPMLAEAAGSVGSPQIRSVATIGGNLCQRPRCWYYRTEDAKCLKKGGTECFAWSGLNKYNAILGGGPSYIVHPSDMAPVLVGYDAELVLQGSKGSRTVPVGKFFTLPSDGNVLRENVLADDEVVRAIRVPAAPQGTRSLYVKFRERESYDFALASVALSLTVEGGKVTRARVVLGGVAPIPWRSEAAEAAFVGHAPDAERARIAGEEALRPAEPLAMNAYKIPLVKGLLARAVQKLGS